MALNSSNTGVAVTGEVSVGPTSTTAPTDTTTALTGFTGLGYVSEDGITESHDRSTDDIKAWQNSATVRTVVTDSALTYNFTLIETTVKVVETALGVTVTQTVTDGSYVVVPSATGGRKSFVIDVVDGANIKRIYIPQGEVTEVGDTSYTSGDAIGFELTITTYPDTGIGGNAKVWDTRLKS